MSVFFLFLLGLTLGILTTLFWIPEKDLGRGYFQLNALIVLALLSLAVAVDRLHPMEPFGSHGKQGLLALGTALVSAFGYYAAVWREQWRWARLPAGIAVIATTVVLVLSGSALTIARTPLPHRPVLLNLSLVSCALLLGWSLVNMLLGHWYLISPKLTFRYLIAFCRALVALVLLRWLAVGVTLATALSVDSMIEPHPWRLLVDFGGQGMFFWFRLVWGLAVPLLLAFMALHCARNRSNQSATGILYVLVMGTFIGEITALYLTLTTGVPV